MATLVYKFGGTSVATRERIAAVAERVADAAAGGDRLAVVVSARGDATDRLIEEAEHTAPRPHARELDLLMSTGETASAALVAMAISAHGPAAVALSGIQAGVVTDGVYGRGRIERLDPVRVRQEMDAGRIPIVAGFQGLGPDGDVVTLGRGASDTTAVALAAALSADRCEIYTDVEGVYTADPRCVPRAHKLDAIGYGEMLEMAQLGAKVVQHRSVGIAQRFRLPVVVRSSFVDTPGTSMMSAGAVEIESVALVRGVAHDTDVARITVRAVRDRPGLAHGIFQPLADHGINIDVIVQNVSDAGTTDISFTVSKADMATAVDPRAAGCRGDRGRRSLCRRQPGQSRDRRRWHSEHSGHRRPRVWRPRRCGHQHPGHYHQRNPHHLSGRRSRGRGRRAHPPHRVRARRERGPVRRGIRNLCGGRW